MTAMHPTFIGLAKAGAFSDTRLIHHRAAKSDGFFLRLP